MTGVLVFLLIAALLYLKRKREQLADARRLADARQVQIDVLIARVAELQAQSLSEREQWDRAVRIELGYAIA